MTAELHAGFVEGATAASKLNEKDFVALRATMSAAATADWDNVWSDSVASIHPKFLAKVAESLAAAAHVAS